MNIYLRVRQEFLDDRETIKFLDLKTKVISALLENIMYNPEEQRIMIKAREDYLDESYVIANRVHVNGQILTMFTQTAMHKKPDKLS